MKPKSPFSEYPCLSSTKMRQARYLVPVARRLAALYPSGDRDHDAHRNICLHNLSGMCDLIDKHLLFMPLPEWRKFRDCTNAFLSHYSWLSKESIDKEVKLWSETPKFHFSAHLVDQARYLSPHASRLYGSESFIGVVCRLANACLSSTASHRLSEVLFSRYGIGMHLLLTYGVEDV